MKLTSEDLIQLRRMMAEKEIEMEEHKEKFIEEANRRIERDKDNPFVFTGWVNGAFVQKIIR